MILPVNNSDNITVFGQNEQAVKPDAYSKDTLLKNNLLTRTRITVDKLSNALTVYPAKGFKGSKNANFYEFLTMGMVPYLAGSVTMIALSNAANRFFSLPDGAKADAAGKHMALGVILYGIFKNFSKGLTNLPVKLATGLDTDLPYAKVNYELPDNKYDTDITNIEYHKVPESVEFPRVDLLDEKYFAMIARKNGRGKDLNDPAQEAKPIIRDIIVRTTTAKNFSSYLWAAVGVGVALQKPWEAIFNMKKTHLPRRMKLIVQSFVESCKSLLKETPGRILTGTAAAFTILGAANTIINAKRQTKPTSPVNTNEKYMVD